jgi:hypothetical protein
LGTPRRLLGIPPQLAIAQSIHNARRHLPRLPTWWSSRGSAVCTRWFGWTPTAHSPPTAAVLLGGLVPQPWLSSSLHRGRKHLSGGTRGSRKSLPSVCGLRLRLHRGSHIARVIPDGVALSAQKLRVQRDSGGRNASLRPPTRDTELSQTLRCTGTDGLNEVSHHSRTSGVSGFDNLQTRARWWLFRTRDLGLMDRLVT